ncbi:MAG: mechanosensitive ion channel [Clostridiales bacterium]|jgi:small conductance mechanosensitive channel|nr:mechanosensitive ion channel [Clostridiales bacterium]
MEHLQSILDQFVKWLTEIAPNLIAAILILVIGWWLSSLLSKSLRKAMHRGKLDAGIISFVYSVTKNTLRVIVLISTAAKLGINVTSIIAAIGAAGVTIGLALKDSLANVASGALIIINKPFHVGDYLEIEGLQGTVTKIEMLNTTLNTFDNKSIVIPNSRITSNNIVNFTAQQTRRLDLSYGVSYDADLTQVKTLLNDLVRNNALALPDPAPVIAVGEHKDSSVQIVVKIWCEREHYWDLYYQMQESVKRTFDQHHIVIPFHQMDVHVVSSDKGTSDQKAAHRS